MFYVIEGALCFASLLQPRQAGQGEASRGHAKAHPAPARKCHSDRLLLPQPAAPRRAASRGAQGPGTSPGPPPGPRRGRAAPGDPRTDRPPQAARAGPLSRLRAGREAARAGRLLPRGSRGRGRALHRPHGPAPRPRPRSPAGARRNMEAAARAGARAGGAGR